MWQLRIYDMEHFWKHEFDEMPLIKELESEPDTDSVFKIGYKYYRWCAVSPEYKVIGIKEINFIDDNKIEEQEGSKFICPYCLTEDYDAWELSEDNNTVECGYCGSEIEYEREYEITYRVTPVKRNKVSAV